MLVASDAVVLISEIFIKQNLSAQRIKGGNVKDRTQEELQVLHNKRRTKKDRRAQIFL